MPYTDSLQMELGNDLGGDIGEHDPIMTPPQQFTGTMPYTGYDPNLDRGNPLYHTAPPDRGDFDQAAYDQAMREYTARMNAIYEEEQRRAAEAAGLEVTKQTANLTGPGETTTTTTSFLLWGTIIIGGYYLLTGYRRKRRR